MNVISDDWILVPKQWYSLDDDNYDICRKFLFYSIRPINYTVELAESSGGHRKESSGGHRNETQIIRPLQVSLIYGLVPGFFRCITITSLNVDNKKRRILSEYIMFGELGQAKTWYLGTGNLLQGPYEVFNGPNPISVL